MIQRSFGCLTFGPTHVSSAIITTATSSITGHLAMFQTVTALSPRPITSPIERATEPLATKPIASTAISTTITSVITSCSGRSFQNGRVSSTS